MPTFGQFALRDLVILAVGIGAGWLLAERSAGSGFASDFSGFVCGVLLTAGAGVLHEWGHILFGLAVGSAITPGRSLRSNFTFNFDAEQNSLRQFLWMSFGGFLVTGAIVWAFYTQLPPDLLATRVARGGVMFLAFLGVALELPLVIVALVKRGVPAQVAVVPPATDVS